MADDFEHPEARLAQAMGARGRALSPAQARRLLDALLRLAELGALVPVDDASEGPVAYNMGPSVDTNGEK